MMHLFQQGAFKLHSGNPSWFKIDCDELAKEDWDTIAKLTVQRVGYFGSIEGVPTGGYEFAKALRRYCSIGDPLLIVDDVFTTGISMETQRAGRDAIGVVLFARNPTPS